MVLFIEMAGIIPSLAMKDTDSIGKASKTIEDSDGQVSVSVDWLARPGEFMVTIDYFGYLTQEGMVNAWMSINGVQREFVTMKVELPNRHQKIRFLSFHPMTGKKGPASLKKLEPSDVVDYLLFRNAPYYPQFGKFILEIKFFANGRWDGNANEGNKNFVFEFNSPVSAIVADHS